MSTSEKEVVCEFESRHTFMEFLTKNPGYIIVKFGADWCGPCKNIETELKSFFNECPSNVICCDIDVDESFDLFAYLKSKKMVNGIPAVLVYEKGNTTYIPGESYIGVDKEGFNQFTSHILKKIRK